MSLVTSKQGRARLAYAAASFLVVWHTLAMVIAASPESALSIAMRQLFHPYLTLFRLDNNWGFFAPNVGQAYEFRYVVEDTEGKRHTFVPAANLSRLHPRSMWIRDWYKTVMAFPDVYADAAAAALCRDHADLKPVSITLLEVEQTHFAPGRLANATLPLAPEFVRAVPLRTVPCPDK